MPELVELHREWAPRGVRVQAVSIDLAEPAGVSSAPELRAFLEQHGFALPVLAFAGDWDALTDDYRLPGGPPSNLVLDQDGQEVARLEGSADKAALEALLTRALGR